MTGSQISHDLYKYVPLRLLENYKLLLVLYKLNTENHENKNHRNILNVETK